MKKKHENTIFPSSPDTTFLLVVYKSMVTECQNWVVLGVIPFYT